MLPISPVARTYVIARRRSLKGFGFEPGAAGPEIEVTRLEPAEHRRILSERDVVGMFPSLPLGLVQPASDAQEGSRFSAAEASAFDTKKLTWGLHAIGIDGCEYDGSGIKVAVLDTGIDRAHQAFRGMELEIRDYTGGSSDSDSNGHGTHCAATIFGRDIEGTRIGVATGVAQAFIGKVIDDRGRGDTSMLVRAIDDAIGAKCVVISLSLELDFAQAVEDLVNAGVPKGLAMAHTLHDYAQTLRFLDSYQARLPYLAGRDMRPIIIAAGGNGSRRDLDERQVAPVALPASATGFVSVGALDPSSTPPYKLARYSNGGVQLCAPGTLVSSARAHSINGLIPRSGTSMAAAHAAGIAALHAQALLAAKPGFRRDLFERLIQSATSDEGGEAGMVRPPVRKASA